MTHPRLLILLTGLLLSAPAGAQPLHLPTAAMSPDGALHTLDRLAFGARPGEVEATRAMGVDRWIEAQLRPASIPELPLLGVQLALLPSLAQSDIALFLLDRQLEGDKSDLGKQQHAEFVKTVLQEAQTAHLDRALYSNRQLQELLVGFWYNHFNVFSGKGFDHVWVGKFEDEAIRPFVFGRFRALLEATARHPAMLFYLDNWQNTAPGSPGAHGRQDGLNENYARELMELHTLGVDGGYSQHDVTELARILTGWGLRDRKEPDRRRGAARPADYSLAFDPTRHDFGDKQFLGHIIAGSGWQEVEQALDLLAASPATAHHLCFQLAQYFVADQPDPTLVDRMTERYLQSGGDLGQVMRAMLESPIFWAPDNRRNKFKTPFEFAVSAIRAANIMVIDPRPLFGLLRELGQPIYGIETPDGYKQLQSVWLNPDGLARRLSFAAGLGSGRLAEQRFEISDAQIQLVLPAPLQPATAQALAAADPRLRPALLLGSPDFMMR
jgi:uncharacterized protein (DUF1800 family)